MITKFKRKDCLKRFPNFPLREYIPAIDEEICSYPTVHKTYILTLESKSRKGLVKALSIQLTKLVKKLEIKSLIFLGDNDSPWISELALKRDDNKPLTEALGYFAKNKVGKRFNGGLEVDLSELPIFLKHFYCLVRCNASLPYFHFMDRKENILGYIHYTGEIHIDSINKKTSDRFDNVIDKTKFVVT